MKLSNQVPRDSAESDPRQFYLEHLFFPGRFPLHILNKSLGVSTVFYIWVTDVYTTK